MCIYRYLALVELFQVIPKVRSQENMPIKYGVFLPLIKYWYVMIISNPKIRENIILQLPMLMRMGKMLAHPGTKKKHEINQKYN